jgi:GDP-L-fucose synthase
MPTNLFGPGDNYHLENSHVIPAMIRKFHLARLAWEKKVGDIIADEKRYGAIPGDIRRAIGYDRDSGRLVENHLPKVVLWGTGTPRREFLHVDDMAAACIHVMQLPQSRFTGDNPSFVNVGTGEDITIREAAEIIAGLVGYRGDVVYNSAQPDGTPRKLLDVTRLAGLGWKPQRSFAEGLQDAYRAYRELPTPRCGAGSAAACRS